MTKFCRYFLFLFVFPSSQTKQNDTKANLVKNILNKKTTTAKLNDVRNEFAITYTIQIYK